MRVWLLLSEACRERRRHWRLTAGFAGVLGSALAIAVACVSLAWPLLWERLPFPNADRLVAVTSSTNGVAGGLAWGDAIDLRERVPAFEKLAVYSPRTWGVQTEPQGHVDVLLSVMVTSELFDALGTRPAAGEPMTRDHESIGGQAVAWLTDTTAVRFFGSAQAAVNRTIWVNAAPFRIAGVLPDSFRFPLNEGTPDLILPLPRADYCCARGGGAQRAIALVRDPRGLAGRTELAADVERAAATLAADFPTTNANRRFHVVDIREDLFGARARALRWMVGGGVCLLLIAAANGAGLWLAAWLRARRDVAIRLALGASAVRLALLRAIEGAIAGVVAAAGGTLIAAVILRGALSVPALHDHLQSFAVSHPPRLEPAAVLLACAAAIIVGIAAALVPHLLVMRRLQRESLRDGMISHPAARRARLGLTALQLAATAILGWTTMAIGENVYTLLTMPRGFEVDRILVTGIGVPEARYDTDEKMIGFHEAVIARLGAVPGVIAAAGGVNVPQGNLRTRFLLDGQTLDRTQQPTARVGIASPELLPLLDVSLRRGRGFTPADRWRAPRVALVNETFVRTFLADRPDPLREGLRLSFYNGFAMKPYERVEIVGIIADTRNDALLLPPQPQIVIPAAQVAMEGFFYFVKTARPPASIDAELRDAIWDVDPAIQRVSFRRLDDHLERGLNARRAVGTVGLSMLLVAMVIVGAGLFASLSAALAESARELAIRAVLGATPAGLARESLRWALAAAAIAAVTATIGVPLVAANVTLEKAVLQPSLTSVALCVLAVSVVAVAAAVGPARRAASVSPVDALRPQ